jgi:bifunctional non-homologous end joining protein LigD
MRSVALPIGPPWVKTAAVPSRREEKRIDYCVMDDLPALIWAANLADLELHTFLHRALRLLAPPRLPLIWIRGHPLISCFDFGELRSEILLIA